MSRSLRRLSATIAIVIVLDVLTRAQSVGSNPTFDAFEVATVKPTGPDPKGRWIRMQSANRFEARNHTVRTLVAAAYDLSPKAISGGPGWVDSDHWDILAKTPTDVRPNLPEQMKMLRQLLNERFKIVLRSESRVLPIYVLEIAKGGAKLKATTTAPDATPAGPPPLVFVLSPTVARLAARYATMAEFASVLQRSPLDRPVVDRTGLAGRYDFDLEFAPDDTVWGGMVQRPENSDCPGLFSALQEQLGLRLEATKGPVEALMIEAIEKPSGN